MYLPVSDLGAEAGEELYGWTKNPTKLQGEGTMGRQRLTPKSDRMALDTSSVCARGGW